MSDNRTNELREKLNKLIIELDRLDITLDSPASDMTLGEYEQEREKLLDEFIQAIAATLWSERETCHAESDLSEWVCSNCQCWIPLGLTPENIMHASEWRYCPHCGAKVKAVSAR